MHVLGVISRVVEGREGPHKVPCLRGRGLETLASTEIAPPERGTGTHSTHLFKGECHTLHSCGGNRF